MNAPRWEWQGKYFAQNSVAIEDAVNAALAAENTNEEYLAIAAIVQHEEGEVFEEAITLCESGEIARRRLGVRVIYPRLLKSPALVGRCCDLLVDLLAHESDPVVLAEAVEALGWSQDVRAIPLLIELRKHPDASVRRSVALGLLSSDGALALSAKIELSADASSTVREWAVSGIGTANDVDTPEIRAARLARCNDEDEDVRGEALLGLARRADLRVVEPLLHELLHQQRDPFEWNRLKAHAVEAAKAIGHPHLHRALIGLRQWWGENSETLESAIACCAPAEQEDE